MEREEFICAVKSGSMYNDRLKFHAARPDSGERNKYVPGVKYRSLCGQTYLVESGGASWRGVARWNKCERCVDAVAKIDGMVPA